MKNVIKSAKSTLIASILLGTGFTASTALAANTSWSTVSNVRVDGNGWVLVYVDTDNGCGGSAIRFRDVDSRDAARELGTAALLAGLEFRGRSYTCNGSFAESSDAELRR